jgi:hypothetical protein
VSLKEFEGKYFPSSFLARKLSLPWILFIVTLELQQRSGRLEPRLPRAGSSRRQWPVAEGRGGHIRRLPRPPTPRGVAAGGGRRRPDERAAAADFSSPPLSLIGDAGGERRVAAIRRRTSGLSRTGPSQRRTSVAGGGRRRRRISRALPFLSGGDYDGAPAGEEEEKVTAAAEAEAEALVAIS